MPKEQTEKMEPRPRGGTGSFADYLKAAQGVKALRALAPGADGKYPEEPIPPWLSRVGLTRFEIDTGFGVAQGMTAPPAVARKITKEVKAVLATRGAEEEDTGTDLQWLLLAVECLAAVPADWPVERDLAVDGFRCKPGDTFPQPAAVRGMSVAAREAWASLLPPSLLGQMVRAFTLMQTAPIHYDTLRGIDPS